MPWCVEGCQATKVNINCFIETAQQKTIAIASAYPCRLLSLAEAPREQSLEIKCAAMKPRFHLSWKQIYEPHHHHHHCHYNRMRTRLAASSQVWISNIRSRAFHFQICRTYFSKRWSSGREFRMISTWLNERKSIYWSSKRKICITKGKDTKKQKKQEQKNIEIIKSTLIIPNWSAECECGALHWDEGRSSSLKWIAFRLAPRAHTFSLFIQYIDIYPLF